MDRPRRPDAGALTATAQRLPITPAPTCPPMPTLASVLFTTWLLPAIAAASLAAEGPDAGSRPLPAQSRRSITTDTDLAQTIDRGRARLSPPVGSTLHAGEDRLLANLRHDAVPPVSDDARPAARTTEGRDSPTGDHRMDRLSPAVTWLGSLAALGGLIALGAWLLARRFGSAFAIRRRLASKEPNGSRATPTRSADGDQVAAAQAAAARAGDRQRAADLELTLARQDNAHLRSQLALAQQALERREHHELLGRLSSGIGHELNNLLGVISNSAHLLQRLVVEPSGRAAVAATFRSVEGATRLIQQVLELANGRGLDLPVIDLDATLRGMHELMRIAVGKRIEIVITVATDTRAPLTDVNRLELALLGLLLNAHGAMPHGGRVWIDARNATADDCEDLPAGDYVAVCVSDDGIGMDEQTVAHAFDAYFTSRPGTDACGLGLTQVRQFCLAAGGMARLASTPGLGTAVTLLLPARGIAPPVLPAVPPTAPDDLPPPGSRGRLLLVEDIEELGDVTAALLENYGFSVLRADSAEAALQLLATDADCDIVLSDIVMSGPLDGVDLARMLRERSPELPVVLISGYSTAIARAREFPLLRKPSSPDALIDTLQRALDTARRRPADSA